MCRAMVEDPDKEETQTQCRRIADVVGKMLAGLNDIMLTTINRHDLLKDEREIYDRN